MNDLYKALNALKRIRQETAPVTYCEDFDKKGCCDVIETDLRIVLALRKIKKSTLKHFLAAIVEDKDDYKYLMRTLL